MFQKELYNGIPNVTVWRVLRKHLHLKAYKLSIVQGAEQRIGITLPLIHIKEKAIPVTGRGGR
jgi:hypothetical protein